jgi:hypothetical protein
MLVTGIVTQGRGNNVARWVTGYQVTKMDFWKTELSFDTKNLPFILTTSCKRTNVVDQITNCACVPSSCHGHLTSPACIAILLHRKKTEVSLHFSTWLPQVTRATTGSPSNYMWRTFLFDTNYLSWLQSCLWIAVRIKIYSSIPFIF